MHPPSRPDATVAAIAAAMLAALAIVLAAPGSASAATSPRSPASWAGAPRTAGPVVAATDPWTWPVGPPVVLVAPFRAPPTPYAAGHRGIDLSSDPGAEVRAPADGVVSFAGPVAGRGVLSIDHGDGVVSSIEPVVAAVDTGDPVQAGAPVATVATGGHCDGVCVHFGVRMHGEYVSPLLWLGGVPRAVLLPSE